MTIWCVRVAYWINYDTHTISEYVIFTAFPMQIWLGESARAHEIRRNYRENNQFRHKELTVVNCIKVMIKFRINSLRTSRGGNNTATVQNPQSCRLCECKPDIPLQTRYRNQQPVTLLQGCTGSL
jgi:hypothetical protein